MHSDTSYKPPLQNTPLDQFSTNDVDAVLEMIGCKEDTQFVLDEQTLTVADSRGFTGTGKYQTAWLVVKDRYGRFYRGKVSKTNNGYWSDCEYDEEVTFVQVRPNVINKIEWLELTQSDTTYKV